MKVSVLALFCTFALSISSLVAQPVPAPPIDGTNASKAPVENSKKAPIKDVTATSQKEQIVTPDPETAPATDLTPQPVVISPAANAPSSVLDSNSATGVAPIGAVAPNQAVSQVSNNVPVDCQRPCVQTGYQQTVQPVRWFPRCRPVFRFFRR